MKTKKNDPDMSTPKEVGNVIKASGGHVKAIILNLCRGGVKESAVDFIGGTDYLVGWETDVDDSAAVHFSEEFYASIRDGDELEVAFFHALEILKNIHRWQFDLDPSSKEHRRELKKRRNTQKRTTLKIAGVPVLYKRKGEGGLEKVEELPDVKRKVTLKKQSTYGFQAMILSGLQDLKDGQKEIKQKLDESIDSVITAMFEIAEFDVPRTFVILPYELEESKESTEDDGEGKQESALEVAGGKLEKATGWMSKLTSVMNAVSGGKVTEKVRSAVESKLEDTFADLKSDHLYLYLIDEVTGKPVTGDGYPFQIKIASEEVRKLLPLMTLGLKAISAANVASGLARCFGVPAPDLTLVEETASSFVESMSTNSSVEKYDCLQSVVDEGFARDIEECGGNEMKTKQLRGAALKEFKTFLKDNDPEGMSTGVFCGLSRSRRDGHVVWTRLDERDIVTRPLSSSQVHRVSEIRAMESKTATTVSLFVPKTKPKSES